MVEDKCVQAGEKSGTEEAEEEEGNRGTSSLHCPPARSTRACRR